MFYGTAALSEQESPNQFTKNQNQPVKTIYPEITTHLGDNQVFHSGDIVYFYLSLQTAANITLIYQDASNNLIQVFPSKAFPKSNYGPMDYFLFPDDKASFQFEISEPFGEETIWLFSAKKVLPLLNGKNLSNGLYLLNDKKIESVISKFETALESDNVILEYANTKIRTKGKTLH